ncbi:hypothetical protein SOVF_188430 [Spinacia oleracea]|nr:hypothetical protein SOVF_188430 [Spinacia oleracea]
MFELLSTVLNDLVFEVYRVYLALSFSVSRKYSVFIDQDEVKLLWVNVIERLMKIPRKETQQMRKCVIDELMPRLVYATANTELEKFEDAFTLAVNDLLERAISRFP